MEKINWVLPRPRELLGKEQTDVVKFSDCDAKAKAEKCIAYRMNGKA